MNIGIVVHGPGIVDTGYAWKIIEILGEFCEVNARLGGTMGRTAVIDAGLEGVIDIKRKLLPSESIRAFTREGMDVIFLLNYGKSSQTGHAFGYKVQKKSDNPPLIQIERPGEADGTVISWRTDMDEFAREIARKLKLKLLYGSEVTAEIEARTGCLEEDRKIYRKIAGVSPGENIFVNGMVVGKSTSSDVTLVAENGKITRIEGGILKEHGIRKLGVIDLEKVIVKTGLLRRSVVEPRVIDGSRLDLDEASNPPGTKNTPEPDVDMVKSVCKVAYLDHAAEDIYRLKDTDLVVTVGDDTTLVAADILFRFNVPIFGITDGDLDKVVEKGFKAQGSVIVELESGWDDLVGEKIFRECFRGKETIEIDNIENFKNDLIQIIKQVSKSCKIKE
ncbi:MAG: hypothetical protein A4E26_01055 [Methanobacterium sp. PtaU1.Bin097]|nr:MAG: hypothetical protein A4E26_01055 [Methanobacterium sp. PtaU1.Bin097]